MYEATNNMPIQASPPLHPKKIIWPISSIKTWVWHNYSDRPIESSWCPKWYINARAAHYFVHFHCLCLVFVFHNSLTVISVFCQENPPSPSLTSDSTQSKWQQGRSYCKAAGQTDSQVDASLQNQNLRADLRRVAKRIRKSQKAVTFSHIIG